REFVPETGPVGEAGRTVPARPQREGQRALAQRVVIDSQSNGGTMPRSRFAFLAPFALCALAGTFPQAPAAPVPKPLMPKEEPARLLYFTRVGDRQESLYGDQKIVVIVTKVEKTEDGLLVHSEEEIEGKRKPNEVVLVSERGIKLLEYRGEK